MFARHSEVWTYVIVTIVALLIWVWAAGETRDQARFDFARVEFTVPARWKVTPATQAITVTVEGSVPALRAAEAVLRRKLTIAIAPVRGAHMLDLLAELQKNPALIDTRVSLVAVDPATISLDVDEIISVPARIRPVIPGVQLEGEVTVEPVEAMVSLPQQVRQRYPDDIIVEATVDRTKLERLQPEIRHTLDSVRLRLPESLAALGDSMTIAPETAKVSFSIRSRIRELAVENVRVQLAGPPEDADEYAVVFGQPVVRNVTIRAEADLVRQIEKGEASVFAIMHLSNREKEQAITAKRISYFMARVTGADGLTTWRPVEARVGDSPQMPEIVLEITRRAPTATGAPPT